MKLCEAFADLLDAFVDGELSEEEARTVRAHLDTCPDCRAYVEDALAIRAAFPDAEDVTVPQGFAGSVMAAVQAQAPAPKARKRQPWSKLLLPLAACFALVVAVGTAAPNLFQEDGSAPEAAMAERSIAADEEAAPDLENGSGDFAEPAAETPAEMTPEAEPPAVFTMEQDNPYFVHITLTASEAGAELEDFQPVGETEEELFYRLTADQYQALLDALAQRGIVPAEETPVGGENGDQALVSILK